MELSEQRYAVCLNHPKQQEIFKLEKLLLEGGTRSYYFNFWEDLQPFFGGDSDGDPESIDWETYPFEIDVDQYTKDGPVPLFSVKLSAGEDPALLDLWNLSPSADKELQKGLKAEQVVEIIENFFKATK